MSDILRQVDEDLRKERLSNLWKKYGIYFIAVITIIVVTTIGFQFKVYSDKSDNEKLVEMYISSTNIKNMNEQILSLENMVNSQNNFLSGLAQLKIINLQIESGLINEAVIGLENIINNVTFEPIIIELATYYLLMIKINEFSEDKFMSYLNYEKIQESKFSYLFQELIYIKKLLENKNEEARKGFDELIKSSNVPLDIKIRAEKFIEIVN